ncbi:LPXTG cell wall anchor domain-containing protein [Halobacillus massiliensis]|uniref:LPXTG cell wall anchor domain-containing protein n=1 Tax=Halobacillus massiliensis TaxID=1926286 RepID=UPI0009E3333B|nr:LPXTG cell wall anchor domain-containing protein [Halobacillus massiliensis]
MKATFKLPKTGKGWFSFALIIVVIMLGSWPVIPLVNNEMIILGMPILMTLSVAIIFITTFTLILINKIGGAD